MNMLPNDRCSRRELGGAPTVNLGETASAIFQICSAEGEVLGTPSAKLRKALEGGPVRIFTPYQSLRL